MNSEHTSKRAGNYNRRNEMDNCRLSSASLISGTQSGFFFFTLPFNNNAKLDLKPTLFRLFRLSVWQSTSKLCII